MPSRKKKPIRLDPIVVTARRPGPARRSRGWQHWARLGETSVAVSRRRSSRTPHAVALPAFRDLPRATQRRVRAAVHRVDRRSLARLAFREAARRSRAVTPNTVQKHTTAHILSTAVLRKDAPERVPRTVCEARARRRAVLLRLGQVNRSGGAPGPRRRNWMSEISC